MNFKLTLATLLAFVLLSNCTQPEKKPTSKPEVSFDCQSSARPLVSSGNNYYYLVTGFDSSKPGCYQYLRHYIKEITPNLSAPFTMHFLDNLPDFKPPIDGMYGSEAIQKKVICQYMYFQGSKEDVMFDPLGYGIYEEKKLAKTAIAITNANTTLARITYLLRG